MRSRDQKWHDAQPLTQELIDQLSRNADDYHRRWRETELPKERARLLAGDCIVTEYVDDNIVSREEIEAAGLIFDSWNGYWVRRLGGNG